MIPLISHFKNLSYSWPFVTKTRCIRPRRTHITSVFITIPASRAQSCAFPQPVFPVLHSKGFKISSNISHCLSLSLLIEWPTCPKSCSARPKLASHHEISSSSDETFTGMLLWGVIMKTRLVGWNENPQSGSRVLVLVFPLDKHRQRPNLYRSILPKEQELSWQMVFPHLIMNIVQHLDPLNEENKQQWGANETL